ncbi:predicted nucleic acid-binding protein, containing PIN domain [Thermococcus kodakarensis KOD1]|uniref:Predicted nucleic acid-binding protein, containing PIN domain n=1 Tax=Thermococcus kodakarensis (strain ATCC BAA-918 / JCM 12380 / KOD1) TaxID=69014 RepID=Q5JEF9_THEKO|nr:type II toxin-antitoxin system VapC family toxin [Thermococcus kodakarensis]WCN28179.1 type II toxin-antitoxin system VapC family toxin [Thermococcus kodakarensis]WCN30476.1 type II toxin-antitoxin system VapC family toxin [Thermococcus kodakarensis]BAD84255.1 predicted nucleic acid-binding protein, containing PIN domain [Thermococcus kodakarensis KOD1]
MKRYLVDSSVILEALRGNPQAKELLESLEDNPKFINPIIFSEVLFVFIKQVTGKSYLTLRNSVREINAYGDKIEKLYLFLRDNFVELPITEEISDMAFGFLKKYGLLPNDAIILATAKFYELSLVTMDSDFKKASTEEGVECVCGLGNGGDSNG